MVEIDDKMVHMTRNALLVAGMEMGKEGDHWPLIKANIHALMHDHENLKVELAVREQLKEHMGAIVKDCEAAVAECAPDVRAQAEAKLKDVREVYEAMFAPVSKTDLDAALAEAEAESAGVPHWRSTEMIIKGLMEENDGK